MCVCSSQIAAVPCLYKRNFGIPNQAIKQTRGRGGYFGPYFIQRTYLYTANKTAFQCIVFTGKLVIHVGVILLQNDRLSVWAFFHSASRKGHIFIGSDPLSANVGSQL